MAFVGKVDDRPVLQRWHDLLLPSEQVVSPRSVPQLVSPRTTGYAALPPPAAPAPFSSQRMDCSMPFLPCTLSYNLNILVMVELCEVSFVSISGIALP